MWINITKLPKKNEQIYSFSIIDYLATLSENVLIYESNVCRLLRVALGLMGYG